MTTPHGRERQRDRDTSSIRHRSPHGDRALLEAALAGVHPVDERARDAARARQVRLTKPPGALGQLEDIGNQLCAIAGTCPPPLPTPSRVVVFAGDHGVHAAGVSAWPQEVSAQMAAGIAAGGAGVNQLAAVSASEVVVVDVGMVSPAASGSGIVDRRVAPGTADMSQGPAMSEDQCLRAIAVGLEQADAAAAAGVRLLVPGEVGLANTTAAAALIAVFTGATPATVTGRGAGADDRQLSHKAAVVAQAIRTNPAARPDDPLGALAAVGGFEHAATVGLLLGAANHRIPVVLDGAISCAAALVAVALCPDVQGHLIAGHEGTEPGITAALHSLRLRPLLRLGLRLGEGSGGVLAVPLVVGAARVLRDMATFDEAGVSGQDAAQ